MAEFPALSVADLARFSGRSEDSYPEDYVEESLRQASLLFRLATCQTSLPDDSDLSELALYAVLEMADSLVLSQPFKAAKASPFSSESIGSYSYSKRVEQIRAGDPTGLTWFDLAVERLGICSAGGAGMAGGGVEVFEHDGFLVPGEHYGNSRLVPSSVANPYYYGGQGGSI